MSASAGLQISFCGTCLEGKFLKGKVMETKECRKIKAHSAHKHLTNHGQAVVWCEGRDYALLLAWDVILGAPDYPTDGETCKCHGLVWNFRDLKDGFCPFGT